LFVEVQSQEVKLYQDDGLGGALILGAMRQRNVERHDVVGLRRRSGAREEGKSTILRKD
jgi:hypothetical protein